jgi:ABC-type branched-subunit amino acid transport system substrate-binding protein
VSPRIPIVVAVAAIILAGCPRRFEPAAAPIVTSPDPAANERFARARALFDGGKLEAADGELAAFIRDRASDPLAPLARVYRGRIALRRGKPPEARQLLSGPAALPAEDPVGQQARYYLGLALVRLGEHERGRLLLLPYLKLIKADDRPALLAALAHAERQLGQRIEAIGHLAELHGATKRPAERQFARQGLEALIGAAPEQELRRVYDGAEAESLVAVLAGARLAGLASAAGRWQEAQAILARTADGRARHRVGKAAAASGKLALGLLVPFTGKYAAVGKPLLAGAVEASGSFAPKGKASLELVVRDSSQDPAAAARDLIQRQHVVALAGAFDPSAAREVAKIAAAAGVPFVTLARVGQGVEGTPLSLLPDNASRAETLARHAARRLALRRVAIVRPESRHGQLMARAFTAAFKGAGGAVVTSLTYPARAPSFTELAKKLEGVAFDGLFVPDSARALGLLAPALARAGLWSAPPGQEAPKGRSFQLLATADGLSTRLLTTAGRYVQGALLAPGFFPVEEDAQVRQFTRSQGRPPGLLEALGHDSVRVFARQIQAGARSRAELLAALRGGRAAKGMTGAVRFGADGRRRDPALLYRVDGERIRALP